MFTVLAPRRSFMLALCGLVLVGGMPRVDCACSSCELCDECRTSTSSTPSADVPSSLPACCCGDAAEGERGTELPALARCPCHKIVTQLSLSHGSRQAFECDPPILSSALIAPVKLESIRGPVSLASAHPDRHPPDDPVSRAQILRL